MTCSTFEPRYSTHSHVRVCHVLERAQLLRATELRRVICVLVWTFMNEELAQVLLTLEHASLALGLACLSCGQNAQEGRLHGLVLLLYFLFKLWGHWLSHLVLTHLWLVIWVEADAAPHVGQSRRWLDLERLSCGGAYSFRIPKILGLIVLSLRYQSILAGDLRLRTCLIQRL